MILPFKSYSGVLGVVLNLQLCWEFYSRLMFLPAIMENELVELSLNEEEDEILQIQKDQRLARQEVQIQDLGEKRSDGVNIDPVLGFNLEGSLPPFDQTGKNLLMEQQQTAMEHDLEDGVFIGEEGKKRNKGAMEELSNKDGCEVLVTRTRRVVDSNQLLSAAAKRQADLSQ
ncbi:hypothetical protein J1N35_044119 [Gossypium stocksii]|uniref:Uncharacterized protein n=1 Tax=Gossypium stocksii TaxID=47602 RepID=A0A9D3U8W1_9ROSI|nr:hypothetical protein J1N35_044119 [Gossypium stocksii]